MALPSDLTQVTVTGTYVNLATGVAGTGTVSFTSALWVTDAAFKVRLVPATVTATLVAGAFSIVLPATNDPQTSPVYTWQITETVNSQTNTFSAAIDYTLSTVDITALAPIAPAAATAGYLLTSSYGVVGGTPGPLDSSGHIPPAQINPNAALGFLQLDAGGKIPEAFLPDSVPRIIEDVAGVVPLRATKCSSATAVVIWYCPNDPTFGGAGYALPHDAWFQKT